MIAFVTGGSGFVGRHLIGYLRQEGHEVKALARSEAAVQAVTTAGAQAVRGDLTDVANLASAMVGCDVVFHAAASTAEWAPYAEFFEANVKGTEHVVLAAKQARVPRLVHVGTEAALLDGHPLVQVDETRPLPPFPLGNYPRTKALAERLVLAANGPDLQTIVVRPRLVWGPDDTSLLPKLVQAVRDGRFAWLDHGRALTSTCHVHNLCEGMLLAAERGRPGEVYFLTDGPPVPVREFLTQLLETRGVTPTGKSLPLWLALPAARVVEGVWNLLKVNRNPPLQRTSLLLFGQEVTVVDAKARRELGYVGHVSREAGLQHLQGRG